jgi:hypothetical protein
MLKNNNTNDNDMVMELNIPDHEVMPKNCAEIG